MTSRISNTSSTSLRTGGIAAFPPRVRRGGRAFTLVELITVMAIMAILMAMIVGVAPRIQDAWRARLTRTRLQTIVAALQAYAEDYSGKFPYTEDKDGIMAVVDAASLGINLSDVPEEYKKEALLYAALTSARRHGPYYKGAGGQTVVRKGTGDKEFNLFADGWERPIRYEYTTATGLLVRSLGKDGATGGDDIGYFVFQN
ncbi:MAG: type II secretion system protein [Planctomycetota bacterium]|nr:type II secretion system protein [Planctomycetota bacterium]